eukprot:1138730-Pelagomonas_calceolata.AAC.5
MGTYCIVKGMCLAAMDAQVWNGMGKGQASSFQACNWATSGCTINFQEDMLWVIYVYTSEPASVNQVQIGSTHTYRHDEKQASMITAA